MKISGFLKEVMEHKKQELALAGSKRPENVVRNAAESFKENKNFLGDLKTSTIGNAGIIAEIKRASPSKGDIFLDLNCSEYIKKYTTAGARAISVLTESRFFKGHLKDLITARETTHLPILRKDFTFTPYQIYETRAAGADAVLLITSILDSAQLSDFILLARELLMEPLVEIHTEHELEKADAAGAKVIGINNRNLQTLKTDLQVSARIAPLLDEKKHVGVEASGISSGTDIQKGFHCGLYNFLIGESIVRSEECEQFIKSLIKTGQ